MRKQLFGALLFCVLTITTQAQVGIGTNTPNASSILDLSSTTKAFLPPRMTTVQRDQITGLVAGMVIFNTTTTCLEVYRGSSWYNLCSGATTAPAFLYVPGGYQGWDPATAPKINMVSGHANKYDAFINIASFVAPSDAFFKYTTAPDFLHTTYGTSGGAQKFDTTGGASGMSVASSGVGYYYITADLNPLPDGYGWTASKTTWSIIGDATPGGWNADTPMSYDVPSQTWKVTANMITAGSYKFRANNVWILAMGITAGGKLAFSDNPFLGYDGSIQNITVPSDGNYTITLDLHTSGDYKYTAVKN